MAGGDFTSSGRITLNGIGRAGGTVTWFSLGTGMNAPVRALKARADGSLVAGGDFSTAGDNPANFIASWYTFPWQRLGDGMNSSVLALEVLANGDVVAGGLFTSAGGTTANHIARWNGSAWRSFDAGMDGPVNALARLTENQLIAGGSFSSSSGVPTRGIARWSELSPIAVISSHPASTHACVGETVFFQVSATGDPAASYQWRKGGVNLSNQPGHIVGAASRRLTIIDVLPSDAGVGTDGYDCVVSNACGSVTSDRADLVICAADFNCSGVLNSQDYFDFLGAFFVSDPGADFDGSGSVDSADFFAFLAAFFAGCE